MKSFTLLGSEIVYQGRSITLRRDNLRTPDDRTVNYDIIEHPGSVVLVPVDEETGLLYFVRQYRHAAGDDMLELPAGTREPGEDPQVCAAREIREEIGMAAATLREIGSFYLAPGYSTELMHVFLATGLTHDPLTADADEFLSVETHAISDAYRLAESGGLSDAKTLAALALARPYLKQK